MKRRRAGQILLTVVALFTGISPYLADWNASHIYNPAWPPHARFHNAQTMSMAALLAVAALLAIWLMPRGRPTAVLPALGFVSLYWVSQAMAFAFPGVAWTDPELLTPGQSLDQFPQQVGLQIAMFALISVSVAMVVSGTRTGTATE